MAGLALLSFCTLQWKFYSSRMGVVEMTFIKEFRWLLLAGLLLFVGCTCNPPTTPSTNAKTQPPDSDSQINPEVARKKLLGRGKFVYNTNCTACHNSDPKRAGSVGPEIHGASFVLLEARIVQGTYPPGYQPKRSSAAMPATPHLKDDLPALQVFLNQ